MDYELSRHTRGEDCNCPRTVTACEERRLKKKMSDSEYIAVLRDREIQQLEKDVRIARLECQKLRKRNDERALENNNLLDKNQRLKEKRQRLADQLALIREKSEPEEEEVRELETVGQNAGFERELGNPAEPEVEAEAAENGPAENLGDNPQETAKKNQEAEDVEYLAHREEISRRNTYVEVYYLDGPHW